MYAENMGISYNLFLAAAIRGLYTVNGSSLLRGAIGDISIFKTLNRRQT